MALHGSVGGWGSREQGSREQGQGVQVGKLLECRCEHAPTCQFWQVDWGEVPEEVLQVGMIVPATESDSDSN